MASAVNSEGTLIQRRENFDAYLDRCGLSKIGSKNSLVALSLKRTLALISYPNISKYIEWVNSDVPIPDQRLKYFYKTLGKAGLTLCISPPTQKISDCLPELLPNFPSSLLEIIENYLKPLKAVFVFKDFPPVKKGYEESAEFDVLVVDGMDPWNSEQWISCEASLETRRGMTFKWDQSKKELQLNKDRTYTFRAKTKNVVLEAGCVEKFV